jgi:hypothetical protein
MTVRNVPLGELVAAFLRFDGDVLLHHNFRFSFPKNQHIIRDSPSPKTPGGTR